MLMQYKSKSNYFKCPFSFDFFTPVLATVAFMVRIWKTDLIEEDDVCAIQKGRRNTKKWGHAISNSQYLHVKCALQCFCPTRFMRMQFPGSLPGQMCSLCAGFYFLFYLFICVCVVFTKKQGIKERCLWLK